MRGAKELYHPPPTKMKEIERAAGEEHVLGEENEKITTTFRLYPSRLSRRNNNNSYIEYILSVFMSDCRNPAGNFFSSLAVESIGEVCDSK